MGLNFSTNLEITPIPTHIFRSNAGTPGVGGCIKVKVSIIDIRNYIKLHIRSTHVPPVARSVQKKNLDEHMQIHTPTLRFACTKCGKEFHWRSSLSKHTLCKHPSTPPPFSLSRQVPKSRILKANFLNCSDSW